MYTASLSSRPKSKHACELSNPGRKLSIPIIHMRHSSSPNPGTTIGPTRSYGTDPIPQDTLVPRSQGLAEATYKQTPQCTHFRKRVLYIFFQIFPCKSMHIIKQIKISYYVLVIQLKWVLVYLFSRVTWPTIQSSLLGEQSVLNTYFNYAQILINSMLLSIYVLTCKVSMTS